MPLDITDIQNRIESQFAAGASAFRIELDVLTFEVNSHIIKDVIRFMHQDEVLRFNFLTDLCGVHYPDNDVDSQFAVVYLLHNWIDNVRVRVKTFLSAQNVELDSVTEVFQSANWMERETYDFFGIKFKGHPKLKRILNDEGMVSFPLRKEYPLEDRGRSDKDDRFFGRTTNNLEPK